MDGTPRQTEFHERKQRSQGAPGVTAWNPVAFDFGSYIAEIILLLSLGAMMTIYRNLCGVRKESEQAGASVRDSAPV